MRARRWLSRLSFTGGLLVVLIGIAHGAVTPMVYRGFATVMPERALGGAYLFAVMGLYVVFARTGPEAGVKNMSAFLVPKDASNPSQYPPMSFPEIVTCP